MLATAMGESVGGERLAIYADDLCDLPTEQVATALRRARRELRFFPRISELRELAGEYVESPQKSRETEAILAFDKVMAYVRKFVSNDPEGNYGPQFGSFSDYPTLPQRDEDVVRRTGGWKIYKCLDVGDYPFQQKRFCEAYLAWTPATSGPPELPPPERKQLSQQKALSCPDNPEADAELKQMFAELNRKFGWAGKPKDKASPFAKRTEASDPDEFKKRREMQKQQAAEWLKLHPQK
jgi:hypothetical protein